VKNVKAEIDDEPREEYDLQRLRVRKLGTGRNVSVMSFDLSLTLQKRFLMQTQSMKPCVL
jgi:hypothetical protein